ncbi:hypothetical protein S7711_11515 [Stachybotrys chartarum IBT 7711]|uniref:Retrotransposon gag domain-containing protein n=1 Tax=Stachybotrys chartarum (strain CBS 109288 / IBT 7711) TaxID=1280523 RepID=A0A084B1X0_STACB|nr:hypothetical protein S7711_11515 [Stachybotrys chartarum IBT 7711]
MEQLGSNTANEGNRNPWLLALTGDELEARVEAARREHRDKTRRQCLRDMATIEESRKRCRLEGQAKINIKVPTLSRDQFRDVSGFIRDLASVFKLHRGEFKKDELKALYMSTCLQGAWKQRWNDHLTSGDSPTRTTIAIKQLRSINRGANQTFDDILPKFEDIIAEMGEKPSEQIKSGMFLNVLNDEYAQRLTSTGTPTKWRRVVEIKDKES